MALNGNDIVTCFVFGKRKLKKMEDEVVVKPKVFEPQQIRNDLSVSRISDLIVSKDTRSIWFIGKIVERDRQTHGDPSNLYGRADLKISQIIALNLVVVPDEPPPRHHNIEGFPSPKTNSECLLIQQKLADHAEGFLANEVTPDISNVLDENVGVKSEFN